MNDWFWVGLKVNKEEGTTTNLNGDIVGNTSDMGDFYLDDTEGYDLIGITDEYQLQTQGEFPDLFICQHD